MRFISKLKFFFSAMQIVREILLAKKKPEELAAVLDTFRSVGSACTAPEGNMNIETVVLFLKEILNLLKEKDIDPDDLTKFFTGFTQLTGEILLAKKKPEELPVVLETFRIVGNAYTSRDVNVTVETVSVFLQEILDLLRNRRMNLDDIVETLSEARQPRGASARYLAQLLTEVSRASKWAPTDWAAEIERRRSYGWHQTGVIRDLLDYVQNMEDADTTGTEDAGNCTDVTDAVNAEFCEHQYFDELSLVSFSSEEQDTIDRLPCGATAS